eukprot:jgi/Mesen1/10892/ME000935S10219
MIVTAEGPHLDAYISALFSNAARIFSNGFLTACSLWSRRPTLPPVPNAKEPVRTWEPVYVRFENQTCNSVSVYWLAHSGQQKLSFQLQAGCCVCQLTYEGQVWIVRDTCSQLELVRTQASGKRRQVCCLQPFILHSAGGGPLQVSTEADVCIPACYTRQLASKLGIPIVGHSQVATSALLAAADIITHMLQGCSQQMVGRLQREACKVAIIARDQVTTDILEHSYLRGSGGAADGRDWDRQVRGLGGTRVCPTCSVGEENVLRCPRDRFCGESILVHEFGHTVMEVGFDEAQKESVRRCYLSSKGKYTPGIYMVADEKEYWAEATQSWFDASRRSDVNDGINTREKLRRHDPEIAALLEQVYGDGDWRYNFTPSSSSSSSQSLGSSRGGVLSAWGITPAPASLGCS